MLCTDVCFELDGNAYCSAFSIFTACPNKQYKTVENKFNCPVYKEELEDRKLSFDLDERNRDLY